MEKIKPIKSKSSILSLKFQRKSDYTKFLKFIQVETKKLKGIVEPKENKLKDILKVGGVGLLGLGLFNLVGKGKDAINKTKGQGDFQIPFAIGRARDKDIKSKGSFNIKPFGEKPTGQSQKIKIKTPVKTSVTKKVSKPVQTTVNQNVVKENKVKVQREQQAESRRSNTTEAEIGGKKTSSSKSSTATINNNQGKQGPTGGTSGRGGGKGKSFDPNRDIPEAELSKLNRKISRLTNSLTNIETKKRLYGEITNTLRNAGASDEYISNFFRNILKLDESFLSKMPDSNEAFSGGKSKGSKPVKITATSSKNNIFKRFMNFYNEGRNVRFPDENKARFGTLLEYFKENPDPTTLFGDDSLQKTRSDEAFKTGKKGIRTLRPLKAFTLKMLKTGPTPLFRQVIERPFRSLFRTGASGLKFLKNNPLVNALLKSRVVKGGLFVIDAIFAGQEFYDLFLRPGDNVFTSLYDLYVSINNAYFQNDPEKLKYFITESKGSHSSLFGRSFTNEQIRKKEIERNLKIKRLKEAAAGGEGGGNNIIVVPQNQQSNNVSGGGNEMPRQTGRDDISFVPFEPLNIGDDILLHKLNQ